MPSESIPDQLRIIDIVAQVVHLQQSNKVFKGPCPFHHDDQLSFMVSPAKNIFKCFGCGKEGGPSDFLKAWEEKL